MKLAVVGGGILGRLVAFFSLQRGDDVSLFDRQGLSGRQGASHAAGGMLAPFAEAADGETGIIALSAEAMALWQKIFSALTPAPLLTRNGSLILAHSRDSALFDDYFDRLRSALDPSNETHTKAYQILDGQGLLALEPDLAAYFQRGLYFTTEAHVEPDEVMRSLALALEQGGVHRFEQQLFTPQPNTVIAANGQVYGGFDVVVDARGYGAAQDIPALRGVRGESLLIRCPGVAIKRPVRLLHPRYSLYLVPRKNHRFYLGATSLETDDEGPIKVQSALELLSACYSIHHGFAEAEILDARVGIRPAFPDHLPRLMDMGGLIQLNGLYRHGYLLAPILARQLMVCLEESYS